MHLAASSGLKRLFDWLLQEGHDPWKRDFLGNTPLHCAAHNNHIEIIQEYIRLAKGPTDIDIDDDFGNTPLLTAMDNGTPETIQLLISAGADIRKRGIMEYTSLMLALGRSNTAVAQILLDQGVAANAVSMGDETTALHWAAKNK